MNLLRAASLVSLLTLASRITGLVREQMVALGVDPSEVDARLAALSDQELSQIAGQIDQLPAGQGPLGLLVVVLLIILLVVLITRAA